MIVTRTLKLILLASAPAMRHFSAGDTFSDVTESMCLDAEAQTLAAATVSAACAAQVCPSLPSSGSCFASYSMCTLVRVLVALHWPWECRSLALQQMASRQGVSRLAKTHYTHSYCWLTGDLNRRAALPIVRPAACEWR